MFPYGVEGTRGGDLGIGSFEAQEGHLRPLEAQGRALSASDCACLVRLPYLVLRCSFVRLRV